MPEPFPLNMHLTLSRGYPLNGRYSRKGLTSVNGPLSSSTRVQGTMQLALSIFHPARSKNLDSERSRYGSLDLRHSTRPSLFPKVLSLSLSLFLSLFGSPSSVNRV